MPDGKFKLLPIATELFSLIFADDTTFIATADTHNELTQKMNQEIDRISKWFRANRLVLHPMKTRIMGFFNTINKIGTIKMNSQVLVKVGNKRPEKTYKLLGVHIDECLGWKQHIEYVANKVSTGLYALTTSRNQTTFNSRKLIYESLIASYMNYALAIWGGRGTHVSHMDRLIKLQKKSYTSSGRPIP